MRRAKRKKTKKNCAAAHLVDVELVLPPRQLSVAGGELSNEVVSADGK